MIRKLATIPGHGLFQSAIFVLFLSGVAAVHAQQPPAEQPAPQSQAPQQPQTQQQTPDQSSSKETSEETTPARRKKPPNYKKWTFNAGGGANLPAGTTNTYVRGGGGVVAAGVARNANKYLGLRLDFQFNNLPLRTTALEAAQAPSATSQVYALMLDPIINVPVTKVWSGYIVAGPAF